MPKLLERMIELIFFTIMLLLFASLALWLNFSSMLTNIILGTWLSVFLARVIIISLEEKNHSQIFAKLEEIEKRLPQYKTTKINKEFENKKP